MAITDWQLRLRTQLRKDKISYRELASRMKTSDTLITNHLTGKAKQESLTFIRRISDVTGYKLDWIIFGDNIKTSNSQRPLLTRLGVRQWLEIIDNKRTMVDSKYLKGFFSVPDNITLSSKSFVWQIESPELEHHSFPPGSYLFIDPVRELTKREPGRSPLKTIGSPFILLTVKSTNGLMICRMETIADQIWLLHPSRNSPAYLMEDVDIIGKVACALRDFDLVV